jgi:hypothetical protein
VNLLLGNMGTPPQWCYNAPITPTSPCESFFVAPVQVVASLSTNGSDCSAGCLPCRITEKGKCGGSAEVLFSCSG